MKRILALLTLALFFSYSSFAQIDKTQIEAAIVQFFDGLSELNNDKLKDITTPDFLLLEVGDVWNLDTLINKIAPLKNMKYDRKNRFEFIKTEQSGNTACVSYHNWADFTVNTNQRTVRWLESAVLINEKGKWRIKLLHSTQITDSR